VGAETLSTVTPRDAESSETPVAEALVSACIVDVARASSAVAIVDVTLTLAAVQFTVISDADTPGSIAASAAA
jgi:hypothetical protein